MQLPVAEVTRYIHRVGRTVLLACHFVASLWSHVVPVFRCCLGCSSCPLCFRRREMAATAMEWLSWDFHRLSRWQGRKIHEHTVLLGVTFSARAQRDAKCPSCIFVAAPVYHSWHGWHVVIQSHGSYSLRACARQWWRSQKCYIARISQTLPANYVYI